MPAADPIRRAGQPRRALSGWGRVCPSEATVLSPRDPDEVASVLSEAAQDGGVIARGAGRSYGDAAQNRGGRVLDTSRLRTIELLDGDPPRVRAGAGTPLSELVVGLGGRGLALPVVPGTRHATVGGAVAADVHGKNHRRDGSFGHHLTSVTLCTPDGVVREVSRTREPELFLATLGGMGLTGVILDATIATMPLRSALLRCDVDRTDGLDAALDVLADDEGYRYTIAWVDLLSRGSRFGRSVVLRSNDELADAPRGAHTVVRLPGRQRLAAPAWSSHALRRPTVLAFNSLRWRRSPRRARGVHETIGEHFFPLDALRDWNRLYRSGLIQYQFAVPDDRRDVLVRVAEKLRAHGMPIYLAVVKRFGDGSGGMLSFPAPGWTLAADMPACARGLPRALELADELVADAGGRVYLAKDARLGRERLERMYPALPRFREVCASIDPGAVLRSDMSERLGLAGRRAA